MDNDVESLDPAFNIDRNIRTICVIPGDIRGFVAENELFTEMLEERLTKPYKGKSAQVRDALLQTESFDHDAMKNDEKLVARLAEMAPNKGEPSRTSANTTIDRVSKILTAGMVALDDAVLIPQATLDSFIGVVKEKNKEAIEGCRTELPADPRGECEKCTYYYACTADIIKITEDDSE